MNNTSFFKIGNIFKAHGLKGEVSVYLLPDAPEHFNETTAIFLKIKGSLVPYIIEGLSLKHDRAFLKLEDVDNKEAADLLKGTELYLPTEQRPELPKGEFYNEELIGFEVSDAKMGKLGQVSEVQQSGLSRLLAVSHQDREVLIPLNTPLIVSINMNNRTISVNLPEGYLDI